MNEPEIIRTASGLEFRISARAVAIVHPVASQRQLIRTFLVIDAVVMFGWLAFARDRWPWALGVSLLLAAWSLWLTRRTTQEWSVSLGDSAIAYVDGQGDGWTVGRGDAVRCRLEAHSGATTQTLTVFTLDGSHRVHIPTEAVGMVEAALEEYAWPLTDGSTWQVRRRASGDRAQREL